MLILKLILLFAVVTFFWDDIRNWTAFLGGIAMQFLFWALVIACGIWMARAF